MRTRRQPGKPALPVIWAALFVVASTAMIQRAVALDTHGGAEFDVLKATQEAFRAVSERMRPFLVRIETVGGSQPRGAINVGGQDDNDPDRPAAFRETLGSRFVVSDGPTTGIIYSADGLIITSSFNFVRDPVLISVILSDGRRFAADLVARDQVRKIALLKVNAKGLPVPAWSDPRDLRVGQWAVALGLGFGGDQASITTGIVSAVGRMNNNAFQTDAKLNPGNYGGPVCDIHSRILGMAVPMGQKPGELAGLELYDSGVGFALPKHRVDQIVDTLKTGKSFYRGWLGISIDGTVSDAVAVANVASPSPMEKAGVEPGDIILSANDRPLKNFGHLVQALYLIPAGQTVRLRVKRDETEFEVQVTLARITDLGPLPSLAEPFDPSEPATEDPEQK
ncbi:MAG: trypsin-like peptidase domain-containing protein [Planctomycetes bacterium]|nr:trypsin-like peptidase domain-containing protein [Planctomycetota bacterium]